MNIRNALSILVSALALWGCANSNDKSFQFTDSFLQSDFYHGYRLLSSTGECGEAESYFKSEKQFHMLSGVYYDYCNGGHALGGVIYSGRGWDDDVYLSDDEMYWIVTQSDKKEPVASFIAGQLFLNGFMVDKNQQLAIYYLTIAARADYPKAQMQLALELLQIDEEENALLWLKKAADNGHEAAQDMYTVLTSIRKSI